MAKPAKSTARLVRNPERTRERILAAALKEFAARGFAGARVDAIAGRAGVNKRMLYHYYGDKEALFREVLRAKMSERQAWADNLPDDPAETLPFWFQAACRDRDWIRLLAWEALQGSESRIIDADRRLAQVERRLRRLKERQARGVISAEFEARQVMLTMVSLTTFPVAFPQLTRLITGKSVHDPVFQAERINFLKKFAACIGPANTRSPRRRTKTK